VHETREASTVRSEDAWPPPAARTRTLHLSAAGLGRAPDAAGSIGFRTRSRGVRFGWTVPEDLEVVGAPTLRLHVEAGAELTLVAGLEKWVDGRYVPFEGSYGFGRDRVTTGWRAVPAGAHQVEVEMGPTATRFRRGDQLRLVVAGRWLWPRNPLTGQFPGWYPPGPRTTCTLRWGPGLRAGLDLPVVAAD